MRLDLNRTNTLARRRRCLIGVIKYAVLTAVESRSSSPVRIPRDGTCQSSLRGLYPCGEGAGYAGGILSAAADGMHCAEQLCQSIQKESDCL